MADFSLAKLFNHFPNLGAMLVSPFMNCVGRARKYLFGFHWQGVGGFLVITNGEAGAGLSDHLSLFADCQTFGFFTHDLLSIRGVRTGMGIVHSHFADNRNQRCPDRTSSACLGASFWVTS